MNDNASRSDVDKANALRDYWGSQSSKVTIQAKDQIGLLFITEVLGLDQETATRFVAGDPDAYHQVGLCQSGIPADTDVSSFWRKVAERLPDLHSAADIEWLINPGGLSGVLTFLFYIAPHLSIHKGRGQPISETLHLLEINAHVYK